MTKKKLSGKRNIARCFLCPSLDKSEEVMAEIKSRTYYANSFNVLSVPRQFPIMNSTTSRQEHSAVFLKICIVAHLHKHPLCVWLHGQVTPSLPDFNNERFGDIHVSWWLLGFLPTLFAGPHPLLSIQSSALQNPGIQFNSVYFV